MKTPSQKICPAEQHTAAGPAGECAACKKRSNINYNIYLYTSHRALEKKQKKFLKNILKKGLCFPKHRAIIHFAADTRELMRRCRTTASTSAFQAEDVGSTPITCSIKQARAKGSGLLAATTAYADVAELADALDSGSSGSDTVGVQVPSSAPKSRMRRHSGFFLFVSQSPGRSTGAFSFVCRLVLPWKKSNRSAAAIARKGALSEFSLRLVPVGVLRGSDAQQESTR